MTDDKTAPAEAISQAVETPPVRKPVEPGSPQDTSSLRAAWRRGMMPDPEPVKPDTGPLKPTAD